MRVKVTRLFAILAAKPFLSFKSSNAAFIAAAVLPAEVPSVFAANSIDDVPAVSLRALTSPAEGVAFSDTTNDAFLTLELFESVALPVSLILKV